MIPAHLEKFAAPRRVLDAGFVRLVDVLGDDGAIVAAARVTTGRGRSEHQWGTGLDALGRRGCKVCGKREELDPEEPSLREEIAEARALANLGGEVAGAVCIEGDRRLIDYLVRNRHTSPLEFCEVVLHVKLPIYVARQWIRHRTASVGEYSGRYSTMIDDAHAVAADEWRAQGESNRQGSSGTVDEWPPGWEMPYDFSGEAASNARGAAPGEHLSARQAELQRHAREVYEERLRFGVAREQARIDLPLANYTEWRWKIDLHNLLHFLSLRFDAHAQQEIREYAAVIAEIVREWRPLAWSAFEEHRLHAATLSRSQVAVLRSLAARLEGVDGGVLRAAIEQEAATARLSRGDREGLLRTLGLAEEEPR